MLQTGAQAPPFSLVTYDGGIFNLQDALEKSPVLLAFYKHNCPTCQLTFPFIERLAQRVSGRVQVIGIAQDDAALTRGFVHTFGITFPILLDMNEYAVSRKFQISVVPSLLLVGQDGKISFTTESFVKADLEALWTRCNPGDPEMLFTPADKVPSLKPG